MKITFNYNKTFLFFIFIASGFSGLIYQSAWTRYIGLMLGHAAYAQALVLAIFMGGMAIGAALAARMVISISSPIAAYGLIEIVIGIFGLLYHFIFQNINEFSHAVLMPLVDGYSLTQLMKWLLAGVLILPQSILLGATFPLMSVGLLRTDKLLAGDYLGGLYFSNSLGAAFGALFSVFILLPMLGLPGATVTAGGLNVLLGGAALVIGLNGIYKNSNNKSFNQKILPDNSPSIAAGRVLYICTALSGLASFCYEIIWIRMLGLAVGSTTHAFELMVSAFILGLAFGGLWVQRRGDRLKNPAIALAVNQILMGIAALFSMFIFSQSFDWVGWVYKALTSTEQGYGIFVAFTGMVAMAVMFPAAFFAGTTLPLFTMILLKETKSEKCIGNIYAWNTLGGIAGVGLAIFVMIPFLGLRIALFVSALVDIFVGIYIYRKALSAGRYTPGFMIMSALPICVALLVVRLPYDPDKMYSGVFRHGMSSLGSQQKVVYSRDGMTATVSVTVTKDGAASISTNGKADASARMDETLPPTADEPTMAMAGLLPLYYHPDPERIGVIGFGSGITTHTLLGDGRVKHVDTVEIERAMVEGARYFGKLNSRAYTDPRSNIIFDDAKTYFSSQPNKYDVIISEPSNPWVSGVGALFSDEFYKFAKMRLHDNGIFVQWIQLYEFNEYLVSSVLRAMTPHFSDYNAWISNTADLIIVAKVGGALSMGDTSSVEFSEQLRAEVARLGLNDVRVINFRRVADKRLLDAVSAAFSGKYPPHSDYRPVLDFWAPVARFTRGSAGVIAELPFTSSSTLEAMNIRGPFPTDLTPIQPSPFTADDVVIRGRSIRSQWLGLTPTSEDAVMQSHTFLSDCQVDLDSERGRKLALALRFMSDLTRSFLPKEDASGMWTESQLLRRCKSPQASLRSAFELLHASSSRDHERAYLMSEKWLSKFESGSVFEKNFAPFALHTFITSLIAKGDYLEARQAADHWAPKLVLASEDVHQHTLVRGLARSTSK